jgi:hypothetical protein
MLALYPSRCAPNRLLDDNPNALVSTEILYEARPRDDEFGLYAELRANEFSQLLIDRAESISVRPRR